MKAIIFTLLLTVSILFSVESSALTISDTAEKPSVHPASLSAININNMVYEESLMIESWMADDNFWNYSSNDIFQDEEESSLEIEDWMTNNKKWDSKKPTKSNVIEVESDNGVVYIFKMKKEKEQALRIEKWMIDDNYWN